MTESNIEEILKRDGAYISTTSGVSMYPMLRHRRDTIVVTPCAERLKKYDVALYRRGGKYVLHRVIKVLPDSYIIRGDNCILREHIPNSDILGRLTCCYRKEREIKLNGFAYKAYSKIIVALNPIVFLKLKMIGLLRKVRGGR